MDPNPCPADGSASCPMPSGSPWLSRLEFPQHSHIYGIYAQTSWLPAVVVTIILLLVQMQLTISYYRQHIRKLKREHTAQLVEIYKHHESKVDRLSTVEKKLKEQIKAIQTQLDTETKERAALVELQTKACQAILQEQELVRQIDNLTDRCKGLEADLKKQNAKCAELDAKLSQATSVQWELSSQLQQEEAARIDALERLRAPSNNFFEWVDETEHNPTD